MIIENAATKKAIIGNAAIQNAAEKKAIIKNATIQKTAEKKQRTEIAADHIASKAGSFARWDKRRVYYTLCFVAINFVDFLRNTQNGNVWSAAANCTGLVLMLLIMGGYSVKELLTPFSYVWTALCGCAIAVAALSGEKFPFGIYIWTVYTAILNMWWIGILLKHILWKICVHKTLSFRPNMIGLLGIAMAVLMTFSVSGRVWPIWFLFMFGIFYLTKYTREDMDKMLEAMIDGTVIFFFFQQIYAYGFRPYDVVRYLGAYPNSNITALYYMIVYAMLLFKLHLLHMRGGKIGWKLFYMAGAAGLLGFQILTMGRTAWGVSILITLMYGICVLRGVWHLAWRQALLRGVGLVLAVVVLFPVVFGTVRWLPTILHHPIWYDGEYSVDKVHSFDDAHSEKYIDMDEFLEAVFGRILGTFSARINNPFVLNVQAAEADYEVVEKVGSEGMDEALNIRLTIYKTYLRDLTWLGHPERDGHYQIAGTDYFSWHAQNVWLQIAYYYGIPTGILFVVLTFVLLRRQFISFRRNKNNLFALVPLFVCVMFFTYGIMELVWNIGQLILFLFFFVQHPQITSYQEGTRDSLRGASQRKPEAGSSTNA